MGPEGRKPQIRHIDRSYWVSDSSTARKTSRRMGIRHQLLTKHQGQVCLRFFYSGDDPDLFTRTIDANIAKSHTRSNKIKSLTEAAAGIYFGTDAGMELFSGGSLKGVIAQGLIGLGFLTFSYLDYRAARREARREKSLLAQD